MTMSLTACACGPSASTKVETPVSPAFVMQLSQEYSTVRTLSSTNVIVTDWFKANAPPEVLKALKIK